MSKGVHTYVREYTGQEKKQDDIISKLRVECVEIKLMGDCNSELEDTAFLFYGVGFFSKVSVSSQWTSLDPDKYRREVNIETIPWRSNAPGELAKLLEASGYELKQSDKLENTLSI